MICPICDKKISYFEPYEVVNDNRIHVSCDNLKEKGAHRDGRKTSVGFKVERRDIE